MSSSSIRSHLKKKLLRRNDSEPGDGSVNQGTPSILPATLPAAPNVFRALPLRALSRGNVKYEDSSVNQGVLLTLPVVLRTTNIWPHDIPTQALAPRDQSPHVQVAGNLQSGTGPCTESKTPALDQSMDDKIKPVADNDNAIDNEDPYGNDDILIEAGLTLPENLWDQAYNEIKQSDPKLMQLYETILSNKLKDDNFDPSQNGIEENVIDQLDLGVRRDQMRQLIKMGQDRTELESQIKSGIKQVIDFVDPAKDVISSIVQAVPGAALPWTVISVALEVRIFQLTLLQAYLCNNIFLSP